MMGLRDPSLNPSALSQIPGVANSRGTDPDSQFPLNSRSGRNCLFTTYGIPSFPGPLR